MDFEVELEARDSRCRAADFEVHIAEVVFRTDNVGENDVLDDFSVFVRERYQAAGNPRDGSGNRHAGIHERERSAADGSHRRRAVRFHDFRGNTNRIRELFFARKHGNEGTFRERTVTDFAATGRAEFSAFANRERREIVVENKGFRLRSAGKPVKLLRILRSSERRDDESLRFAALEDRRAVNTREHIRFAGNRAKLVKRTSVGANAFVQDAFAINFFLKFFKRDIDVARVDIVFSEFGDNNFLRFRLHSVHSRVAFEFARQINRLGELFVRIGNALADFKNLFVANNKRERLFRLRDFRGELTLSGNDFLNRVVCKFEGFDEAVVRHLIGGTFNHHHVLLIADVDKVERRVEHLFVRRVDDKFAVHFTDAHRTNRTVPRNIRAKERGGSAVDHQNIRIRDFIGREKQTDNLNFVQKSFREKRTKRAIAKAGRENFLFRRTPFALKITARETTGGGEFFTIINREREEILVGRAQFVCGGCGYENGGSAAGNRDGAVGLAGDGARADGDAVIFDIHAVFLLHIF